MFLHIVMGDFAADFRMLQQSFGCFFSMVPVRYPESSEERSWGVVCSSELGGEKTLKAKQKPCSSSLFPLLLTFFPDRDHVSLAGQCINIYFCSKCCCTSVVSLWTTLASLTEKEPKTAAWVSSLIHIIGWWCRPKVEPRCEFSFALPWLVIGGKLFYI